MADEEKPQSISELIGRKPKAEPPPMSIVSLTEESKEKIKKLLNDAPKDAPPTLEELITVAWNQVYDPRTPEGMAVRKYLTEIKSTVKNTKVTIKDIVFSEQDKAYIQQNHEILNCVEIAKIIFRDEGIVSPLSVYSQAVTNYIREFCKNGPHVCNENEIDENGYFPPTSTPQAVARIKKYVSLTKMDSRNLTQREKNYCNALIGFLNTLRFRRTLEAFEIDEDRELFESEFIRCCYDKPDLTEEEVDQYIVYSNEVVISKNILKRINSMQTQMDYESEEGKKLSMTIVEAIGGMRKEYNDSIKRQQDLLKDLKIKRSQRIQDKMSGGASISNLVEAWKEDDFRRKTLHLAMKKQEIIKDTIKEITDMDEIKARVFGITEDEVLHG